MDTEKHEELRKLISQEIEKTEKPLVEYVELTRPVKPENEIDRVSRMDAFNNKSDLKKIPLILLLLIIFSVCTRELELPPLAAFRYNKQNPEINEVISFTNRSLRGKTYYWEFGDGENSHHQHPMHFYKKEGEYSVHLTVENALGYDDTIQIIEIIRPDILWPAPGEYQGITSRGGSIKLKITDKAIESFTGTFFADIAGEVFELYSNLEFGTISKTDSGFVAQYKRNHFSGFFSNDTITGIWRHNYGEESFIITRQKPVRY